MNDAVKKCFLAHCFASIFLTTSRAATVTLVPGPNTMSTNRPEDNKAQMFYDYLTHPEVDMMKIWKISYTDLDLCFQVSTD